MEIPSFKIPTIVTVHHLGHLFDKNVGVLKKIKLGSQKRLVKRRLTKAKVIVTVSKATKDDIVRLGIDGSKVHVLYEGVELEEFDIDNARKNKNKLFTITAPSRISSEKGQHILIDAFNRLPGEIKDRCKLIIVGYVFDTKYYSKLKKLAAHPNIEIITDVPKIQKYYETADLIAFPTLMHEGFGRVSIEGLACEKPVVASNFPAVCEVLKDYGVIVKPNDAMELKNAILKIYSNLDKYKKLAKEGRKYVLANYSWDKVLKRYNQLYQDCLDS